MTSQKALIPRASNKDVIDFFVEFAPMIGTDKISVYELGQYNNRDLNLADENAVASLSDPDKYTFQRVQAVQNGYGISFHSGSINAPNPDFYIDQLEFHLNSNTPHANLSGDALNKVHKLIEKVFHAKTRHSAPLFNNTRAFQSAINSHQAILGKLESSLADVAINFSKERIALEAKNSEYREELELKHKALREKLEADFEEKEKALRQAEELLEDRKKKLDDRDNTHARRKIRDDLKKRIDEHNNRFQLTAGTRGLRTPIHISALISLILLGTLIGYYGYGAANNINASSGVWDVAIVVIKPLGLTIAFLGLLTWYLRWMNRWFERHAEAEFQLKQFELDIDRASWVVETALEWRHEQHAAMPDHLIESISRNLFSKSEKDEGADMHPADYLASALLGRASNLRLKLPGGEIEYGAKALKEARPSTDKA